MPSIPWLLVRGLAFNSLLHAQPHAAGRQHFPARAKRVIFLFMHGGRRMWTSLTSSPPSRAVRDRHLPFPERAVQFAERGHVMPSPWSFRQVGQSGHWMSSLWKHLPSVADEICMLHSLCETNVAHGGACMKLHTGSESLLRPSMGAWMSYGLSSENQNLPAFVTLCPTSLHGGVDNFGAAFLPAQHQGVPLGTPGYPNTLAKNARFHYMGQGDTATLRVQREQLSLLRALGNQGTKGFLVGRSPWEARMQSPELAYRMQVEAPEVTDLSGESSFTRSLYGMDEPETENFGQQCLLARRLAERGVRFIQVSHAHSLPFNNEQWDQHSHLEQGHALNVAQIDKPITGLLLDLKARGRFWRKPWCSGEENLAERQPSRKGKDPLVATITPMGSPCGWRAGG